ncbi:MAG TPA: GDCCVxC domain-containing (seleno)protein [Rhizomicrobium sp.]
MTVCELVCPHCGARHRRVMPTDACIWFFECTACGTMLKPKSGDCCVFCSYGSVPCPPVQIACASGDPADVCCR